MDGRRHGIQLLNQQSCHPVQAIDGRRHGIQFLIKDEVVIPVQATDGRRHGTQAKDRTEKRRLADRFGADELTPIASRSQFNERGEER
jgi:hypothetical protein